MSTLKIYGFKPSTYTQSALLVAAESGQSIEPTPLAFKEASHFALHPYGKMPVLEHGDVRLFETLAIVTYLDRTFGRSRLHPQNAADEARMLQWASAAIDYCYEPLVSALHEDAPPSEALAAAGKALKLLDAGVSGSTYFAGSELSLADFLLYPMVEFACAKIGDGAAKGLPSLNRWVDKMGKQQSVKKAKQVKAA